VQGGVAGGIAIDAQGVVSGKFGQKQSPKLTQAKMQAFAEQSLDQDVNTVSPLRKVSLVRLEAEIEKLLKENKPVPTEMQFLAGVQRLDYVFLDTENGDLVVAGPAEGFGPDELGRIRGVNTGRPPLRLDDLIVALRTLERTGELGCSIDPDQQRQADLQNFIRANSTAATPALIAQRFQAMARVLGMQNVRVWGVPADSHFGVTLVEADWRMKLYAIALDRPDVPGFRSHLELVGPGGNSLQRYWITPLYDAFQTNEDRTAYQFAGQRAQVMSQEEYVGIQGQRQDAPTTRITTQRFSKLFTDKFPEVAAAAPVFAELQNCLDLTVLAALFKKDRLPQRVGWPMTLFLDEQRTHFARANAPQQVASLANFKRANRGTITGMVAGGVVVDAMATVRAVEYSTENADRLGGVRTGSLNDARPEKHPWWWD
jgi:hypothetical protein